MYTLRPYQIEAVEAGIKTLTTGQQQFILAPTASGKSLIIADIARQLDGNVIVFQPNKEILAQNKAKAEAMGITDIGVFSASMGEKTVGKLTFSTIGTIYNQPDLWDQFKYCIIDECHLVNAKGGMYQEFIKKHGGAVLGLSASPYRLHTFVDMHSDEKRAVVKFLHRTRPRMFTSPAFIVQISDLYRDGYLSPVEYILDPKYDHKQLKLNSTGADFTEASMREYGKKMKTLEIVEQYVADSGAKRILVFTQSVIDAERLVAALKTKGISAAYVTAETPRKDRDSLIQSFKIGAIQVVANVGVLTTGFDLPELDCVVLARPTQSVALYYQMVGRVLRTHEDKTKGIVIDTCGNVKRFGKVETFEVETKRPGMERLKSDVGYLTGYDFVSETDMEKGGMPVPRETGIVMVNFGKFKSENGGRGLPITEIPSSYIRWVLENFEKDSKWYAVFLEESQRRKQ